VRVQLVLCLGLSLWLSACTSDGSDDSSGTGSRNDHTCSSVAPVCVGDNIMWRLDLPEKQMTVSEIVAAGELSSQEKKIVADTAPEGRAQVEETYQEISQQIGDRIFAKAPGDQESSQLPRDEFQYTYRLSGCAPEGHPCVGEKNYVYDDQSGGSLKLQEVIGFVLYIGDMTEPYLVRLTSADGKQEDQGVFRFDTALFEKGCTKIRDSNHQFCIGEKYLGEHQYTIAAVSAPNDAYPTVIAVTEKGNYVKWDDVQTNGTSLFEQSTGCLPGAADLCMPNAMNAKFLKANYETAMDDRLYVKSITPLSLIGISDVNLVNYDGGYFTDDKGNTEDHTADEITKFYRAQGCTPDGRICAGKVYLAPTWANYDFTVLGWNMAAKSVIGTFKYPNATDTTTSIYDMSDIGAIKGP
jgi:hypothetical protein